MHANENANRENSNSNKQNPEKLQGPNSKSEIDPAAGSAGVSAGDLALKRQPNELAGGDASAPRAAGAEEPPHVVYNGRGAEAPGVWKPIVPWHEPVDGKALLDVLVRVLTRFIILPKWAAETLALWIVHTYAFQLREVSTYLGIESPEKRCGKTTLLGVLTQLVHRPIAAANISSPAFFRVIQETQPTLLIDEGDTFLRNNDELRGIFNAGYTKPTAFVYRVRSERDENSKLQLPNSREHSRTNSQTESPASTPALDVKTLDSAAGMSVVPYSCWCPKAIAAIGRLPDTLADRCIVVQMQRKTRLEQCARLREFRAAEALELRRKSARFAADNASAIASAQPQSPEALHDRAAELWEPLLALADLAGGDWPERARQAAVALTGMAQESNPIGSLMFDLFFLVVTGREKRIFTRTLVDGLQTRFCDRPWMESLRGKPVTSQWLSQQLKPYGVKPTTMRIGEERAKGYEAEELMDVLKRYVPRSEIETFRAENDE